MNRRSDYLTQSQMGKMYIVGECYSNIMQLPNVLTATQFFQRVLENNLPEKCLWIVGQGLSSIEQNLLRLCKTYRSEVSFYDFSESALSTETQPFSEPAITKNIFSKISSLLLLLIHMGKKSLHR